jgi:hypothetical protein
MIPWRARGRGACRHDRHDPLERSLQFTESGTVAVGQLKMAGDVRRVWRVQDPDWPAVVGLVSEKSTAQTLVGMGSRDIPRHPPSLPTAPPL